MIEHEYIELCAAFEAKIGPHFDLDRISTRTLRVREEDRIIIGYTHLAPDAHQCSFMRFVVNEKAGHAIIDDPIMRFMDPDLKFSDIVADDENTAIDQLADWFIANKELITHSHPIRNAVF